MVSIIVPVYNAERFLAETIASVLSQDEPDFELLLINDGSADNSQRIIDGFGKRDSRVRSVSTENRGAPHAGIWV